MPNRKFAVVTGASNGIGFELAKCFARDGFDILAAGRDPQKLSAAAAEFRELGAEVVHTFQGDLAKPEEVRALYYKIREIDRPVDAIAINAGRGAGGKFVGGTSIEDEMEIVNLNIMSSVLLAKLVLPDMVKRGEGRVLFTGSISGTTPVPFEAVYGGSKAFINNFSEALRYELKDTGVTTTVLMPDATETDFFANADMLDTKVGTGPKQDVAMVAKEGFDAMMAGRASVFGGDTLTKVKGRVLQTLLPDAAKEKMAGERSRPGSAEKH